MNYRGYHPEREIIDRSVRAAKSEFALVVDLVSAEYLTPEEVQKIQTIQNDLNWLIKRMEQKD